MRTKLAIVMLKIGNMLLPKELDGISFTCNNKKKVE